jgi:hypothetical protein
MKMKEIGYSRKFNLGAETEEISLVAELEGLENIGEAFREIKETVFALQTEGVTAEPPSITRGRDTDIPWSFNPQEFLDHKWKGKKLNDGSYSEGNCSWGWDFAYRDIEHEEPNFSADALKLLSQGPINIGDDYTVKLNSSGTLVQIQKQRKGG